ncbi:hypothetical protein Micbo1qcDRAFT_7374 [Microdochium bolleyi]|uniref:Uncharacterized protein n=1 Tax=Microdochium bolleyi TaxID=196109 RepID=A0A136JJR7_9PEZI|nr:hypothetical protein Micbo1qcDRAFT_7374 [Microdochium bolleyi]
MRRMDARTVLQKFTDFTASRDQNQPHFFFLAGFLFLTHHFWARRGVLELQSMVSSITGASEATRSFYARVLISGRIVFCQLT